MTRFVGHAILRGLNNRTLRKTYDLGDFTGATAYADASNAMTQITGALEAVTDATLAEWGLTSVEDSSAAAGAGDLFENAMVNVYSLDEDDATAVEHVSQIYIPAASIDIFSAATGELRDIVDITDAALTQYVQQLAQHGYISDGETIQVGSGDDGMLNGKRVIKKVRLGRRA